MNILIENPTLKIWLLIASATTRHNTDRFNKESAVVLKTIYSIIRIDIATIKVDGFFKTSIRYIVSRMF